MSNPKRQKVKNAELKKDRKIKNVENKKCRIFSTTGGIPTRLFRLIYARNISIRTLGSVELIKTNANKHLITHY